MDTIKKFLGVLLVSVIYGNTSIANEPVVVCEYFDRGSSLNAEVIENVFFDVPRVNVLHVCSINTEITSIGAASNISKKRGITFFTLTDILQLNKDFLAEPFYIELTEHSYLRSTNTIVCRDAGFCAKHSSESFISIGDMTPRDYKKFLLSWNKAMSNVDDFNRKSKAVKKSSPFRKTLQGLIKNGTNFTILEISASTNSAGGYGMVIRFEVDDNPYWSISATFANNILRFGYVNS